MNPVRENEKEQGSSKDRNWNLLSTIYSQLVLESVCLTNPEILLLSDKIKRQGLKEAVTCLGSHTDMVSFETTAIILVSLRYQFTYLQENATIGDIVVSTENRGPLWGQLWDWSLPGPQVTCLIHREWQAQFAPAL